MGVRNYTLTVDEHAGVPMAQLVERLREAGFEVAQQLDAIGVIIGRADAANLPRIREMRGVVAVEEDRAIERRSLDDEPV